MAEFFGFVASVWFLIAIGAAVYFWATRTNASQPPIVRRLIGFGLGLAWPLFVVGYFRRRRNEADRVMRSAGSAAGGSLPAVAQLPSGIVAMMEKLGWFEYDPQRSGIDSGQIYVPIVAPLHREAQADPDGFLLQLRDAVLPVGGWAVYGASCLAREVLASIIRDLGVVACPDRH